MTKFQEGKISQSEVEHLLQKHWNDKTFEDILRCTQGDLEACKNINLEKWKQDAQKDIDKVAASAMKRSQKDGFEKKKEALEKINKLIEEKRKGQGHRKEREELRIREQTERFRKEILAESGLT